METSDSTFKWHWLDSKKGEGDLIRDFTWKQWNNSGVFLPVKNTSKKIYKERIDLLLNYEDSLYSKKYENWMDLRKKKIHTIHLMYGVTVVVVFFYPDFH